MTDLTPHHPAVEAAERAATRWMEDRELETDLDGTAYMLTAALPHLTAATPENLAFLRDTPAGQALIAEGRGWTPATERDRRALAILNDPTVPAGTRHVLAKGIRLLHKLERLNER